MKRILIILLLFFSQNAFGWNLSDHRDIARLGLKDVSEDWGLNQKVKVRSLDHFLEKLRGIRESLGDRWQFSNYLQVDPKIDLGAFPSLRYPEFKIQESQEITAYEILSLYPSDPDDGRDQNLLIRDKEGKPQPAYVDQKWFGVLQGANSQAFRHIEKPPFSWKHPLATLGFPFRSIGEASQRAEIYFQLSRLAFRLGEDYWGWRFLAGSFHYTQDLHNPYHSAQISPILAQRGFHAWLSWGRKEKGFIGTMAHFVSNSHRFFESYVSTPRDFDQGQKSLALNALHGKDYDPQIQSMMDLAHQIRDASGLLLPDLSRAVDAMTIEKLWGTYTFHSDGDDGNDADDPTKFLRSGPEFEKNNQKLFEIVKNRFTSAGRAMRTEVHAILEQKEKDRALEPTAILGQLDNVLALSSPIPYDQEDETNAEYFQP